MALGTTHLSLGNSASIKVDAKVPAGYQSFKQGSDNSLPVHLG